ncbi:MAG: type II secretion system GspH family protein [Magnetococcus sp. YQC-3]
MTSCRAGFALVELLVVMALLFVLGSMGIAEVLRKQTTYQIEDALEPLQRLIDAARHRRHVAGGWLPDAGVYRNGGSVNGVQYQPYDETYLQDWLGVDLASWVNFCFVLRQTPDKGIDGDEIEVGSLEFWALLRSATSSDVVAMYRHELRCTIAANKKNARQVFSSNPDQPAGEGRVVVRRYPVSVNSQETGRREGRDALVMVWHGGASISDAAQ